MGIIKWMWEQGKKDEERMIQAAMTAHIVAEEQKIRTTCKKCKKIFSEGIPYKKTMFGKPKNYVCRDCAEGLGLI